MTRSNRKANPAPKTPAPSAVIEPEETTPAPEETTPAPTPSAEPGESAPEATDTPAPSGFRPVEKKAPGLFGATAERDSLGFAIGSFTSRIASLLSSAEGVTEPEILEKALDITPDSTPALRKARKTTLSVFYSDSKKAFGYYPVSRGFRFEEDSEGRRRIAPESLEKAKAAIEGGILSELRKAKTGKDQEAILSRFGY